MLHTAISAGHAVDNLVKCTKKTKIPNGTGNVNFICLQGKSRRQFDAKRDILQKNTSQVIFDFKFILVLFKKLVNRRTSISERVKTKN